MPTVKQMETVKIDYFPKLIYTTTAFKTLLAMMNTTHAKTKEFLFLGLVHKENSDYVVEDFLLVPQQKCSAAYCETDDEAYPTWLAENVPLEKRSLIRLHGHSHVNMGTSPSGTDDVQIKELCNNVSDFFIQLIVNHNMINTVNIWDKTNKLIYNNLEQYIRINDQLLKLNAKNNIIFPTIKIEDGNYNIKKGFLLLNNGIVLDVQKGFTYIIDDNISVSNCLINPLSIIDKNQTFQKEIDKKMEKYIKKEYVQQSFINYPKQNYYERQSYYGTPYVDDYIDDYDPEEEKEFITKYSKTTKTKKGVKHGLK
jgi:hypothetical protein